MHFPLYHEDHKSSQFTPCGFGATRPLTLFFSGEKYIGVTFAAAKGMTIYFCPSARNC
tara:strand:+ start:185 stop:358 length:174 start_codon:yes stop_codon:yes gene_type:complete